MAKPAEATKKPLKKTFCPYDIEREIKFLTDEETLNRIFEDMEAGPFVPEVVERDERTNIYFDTKKSFQLYKRGLEVRGREDGKRFKIDLKAPMELTGQRLGVDENGVFSRREYRYIAKKLKPSLTPFMNGDIQDVLAELEDKDLVPWVQGHFKRKRFTYTPQGFPDTHLEVAFETGYYETMDGSARSDDMYIVEVELKAGDYDGLVSVAESLKERYGLHISLKTKGEMGLEFVAPSLDLERQANFNAATQTRLPDYLINKMK